MEHRFESHCNTLIEHAMNYGNGMPLYEKVLKEDSDNSLRNNLA